MKMDDKSREELFIDAKKRFLEYVKIDTTADEKSGTHPSYKGEWDLAKKLKGELEELGLDDICLSEECYLYSTLKASPGIKNSITLCAHMDTSPAVSGKSVKPIIHENYQGGEIKFPDDTNLSLSPSESPELKDYIGENIITASGNTLLGADNKAGVAEIMSLLSFYKNHSQEKRPELKILFTPDEEIGEGVNYVDIKRLAKTAYTVDGGHMGEYDIECFDAIGVEINIKGISVHPGSAKNILVNAIAVASRFLSELPEQETPEHTEGQEGFYLLCDLSGDIENAKAKLILRDFDHQKNIQRKEKLEHLKQTFEKRYKGVEISIAYKEQYRNMKEVLDKTPVVVEKLRKAIELSDIKPVAASIRGGTDGARLCFMGVPTPNIFTGGMMFHSKKEWIAEKAMAKACETLYHLCGQYL